MMKFLGTFRIFSNNSRIKVCSKNYLQTKAHAVVDSTLASLEGVVAVAQCLSRARRKMRYRAFRAKYMKSD